MAEAEIKVFKYLNCEQIEESKRYRKPDNESSFNNNIEKDKVFFLVSKDTKLILPSPWYYPYSGQWNAYCPFREMQEVEINDFEELKNINVQK